MRSGKTEKIKKMHTMETEIVAYYDLMTESSRFFQN